MSLDRFDLQILGMQIQSELQAERYSRERIAIMNARSAMMREIAERNYQQNQIAMQREAQEQDLAYMALAYAPRRTNDKPKRVIVIPSIDVFVSREDGELEYFMTNYQEELDSKLDELGFRPWTTSDWFLNLVLSPTVRSAMERKGAIFSICLDSPIMNYWDPAVSPVPFSCWLNESMFKEE